MSAQNKGIYQFLCICLIFKLLYFSNSWFYTWFNPHVNVQPETYIWIKNHTKNYNITFDLGGWDFIY